MKRKPSPLLPVTFLLFVLSAELRAVEQTWEQLIDAANLHRRRAEYADAEKAALAALKILESRPGDTVRLARTLNNLGTVYFDLKRYHEAEGLFGRAVAFWEKSPASERIDLARGLHNLAESCRNQGKLAEAEGYLLRSTALIDEELGPEDPALAANLVNLAEVVRAQRKFPEGERLHRRVVAVREKRLGPDQPK